MLRPVVLLFTLAALSQPFEGPAFTPEAGADVAKTFETTAYLEIDDLSIMVGDMDVTEMIGSIEAALEIELGLELTDTYARVQDGRLQRLVRRFDDFSSDFSVEYTSDAFSGEETSSLESELVGETVVFTWDEDLGSYLVAFEDEEGDEDLLEVLLEDMDLRAFLPLDAVEEGDEWEVDPTALRPVLSLGGSIGTAEDPDGEIAEVMAALEGVNLGRLLDSMFEGEVTCVWKGTRDEEGSEVGVIEVSIQIDSTTDVSGALLDLIESAAGEDMPEDFSIGLADLGVEIEGTGLLLWDMQAGRFHHFESQAALGLNLEVNLSVEDEVVDLMIALSGDLELGASAEGR